MSYAAKCGYEVTHIFTETESGAKKNRAQRKKVIDLARARSINLILVSELTRWGRSTIDLIESLHELNSYSVSLIAQNGFQYDISTPHGKMIAGVMASLAEFERDLIRERVISGLAGAKARGQTLGRPPGGKEQKLASRIRVLRGQGRSANAIALELKLSKSAVYRALSEAVPESTHLQGDQVSLDV
jgi:putative DNA-invertase from lambdoid prophage Rac